MNGMYPGRPVCDIDRSKVKRKGREGGKVYMENLQAHELVDLVLPHSSGPPKAEVGRGSRTTGSVLRSLNTPVARYPLAHASVASGVSNLFGETS